MSTFIVTADEVRLDILVPGHTAELGARADLQSRRVHVRVRPAEHGGEVEDADALGDPGGGEILGIAVELDARENGGRLPGAGRGQLRQDLLPSGLRFKVCVGLPLDGRCLKGAH